MKIAQFIDVYLPIVDGVVITVKNYAQWINKKGHSVTVVTSDNGKIKKEKYLVLKSKTITTPFSKIYKIPVPLLDTKFRKRLKATNFDLIHVHSPFTMGHLGLKYARKNNIPIVATFHSKYYDDFLEATKSKFISKLLLKYVINFYEKCDYVWTVNENTKETLKTYGYKGDAEIMPNGVDIILPDDINDAIKKVKSEYNLKNKENIFLFVGQHEWKKNIRKIMEALYLYKKNDQDFKFLMVGTGDKEAEIKELVNKLGLKEHVIFLGKILDREKLTNIYLAADVLLFPSIYDNAPLVVRESAYCMTPAIVVKNSGASEKIIDGINGFLCEDNAISIKEIMKKAVSNKDNLKKIGKKASQTIPISWEKVVLKVYEKYLECSNLQYENQSDKLSLVKVRQ